MTHNRQELMSRLVKAQNHPANISQDIITFSAFMDDAEMLRHVERYESYAKPLVTLAGNIRSHGEHHVVL